MELVGAHGLQGRSAYQSVIQRQGERWIAYVGHLGGRALNPLARREEDNGIRDPYRPAEVAYFIPDDNPLTNNVEVDSRGYIYIVDRGDLGMHILALTGEAKKIANWP